ncbi:hypothetical protein AN958_06896 [Leucoagaricus sp. SymC.cos]|nr:hypothetical protein AN958_06896 [Leucoagaricus sp. SymC.cos]
MTPSSDSFPLKQDKYRTIWKPPRPPFHLDAAYIHYERLQQQQSHKRKPILRGRRDNSLSNFTLLPVDIFYEIIGHLHPKDVLNLSRSTRRLRQLLMVRDARCVWIAALSNVEGLPRCPSDLSEPQFASLAFDQHCHVGIWPSKLSPNMADQIIFPVALSGTPSERCPLDLFLTMDELVFRLPKTLDIPKPEAVFLHTVYPKATSDNAGSTLFYKPAVETHLQELAKLDRHDRQSILRWYNTKRNTLNEIMAVSLRFHTCHLQTSTAADI